mmetsp:Transcript_2479/g.5244  ORF Transcript_2479/g.5244 Transcript_2479/m.5244 type:complete len:294 (+) Transcript_2479:299-1180(+)
MLNVLQILNEQLAGGQLQLAFQDLTSNDLHWILIKLQEIEAIRNISSSNSNVWKINLAGNRKLGDDVAECLHLLPVTVRDIDFSYCGISATGLRNICQFMESNKTITCLVLWGNVITFDGAMHIRDMLTKNTTLQEFSFYNVFPMNTEGKLIIADALECNSTLRKLYLDDCTGRPADAIVYSKFRSVLERAGSSSAIQTLEIGPINRDPHLEQWEETLQKCENLCHLGSNSSGLAYNRKCMYWRALNMYNARKITRDGDIEEILSVIERAVKNRNIDVTYYLVRNNVECISRD